MSTMLLRWILVIAVNADDNESTDRVIPGWQGNPWGPAATAAREAGTLPPFEETPEMAQWESWARETLRDGDILFRMGDARILFGYFPFSRFLARASGSKFSHTGVVAIEDGVPMVYDTTKSGVRRMPVRVWIMDNVGPMAVKRLRPEFQEKVPEVLAFCRRVYEQQVPFDYELGLDDTSFYCVEMTEKAFRAAGLPLSEPVRLGDMERAWRFPVQIVILQYVSRWVLRHPLSLEQPVYFPGNERHGIWSSPKLMLIYPPTIAPLASTTATKPHDAPRTGRP